MRSHWKKNFNDLQIFDRKKTALQEASPELLKACKLAYRALTSPPCGKSYAQVLIELKQAISKAEKGE